MHTLVVGTSKKDIHDKISQIDSITGRGGKIETIKNNCHFLALKNKLKFICFRAISSK